MSQDETLLSFPEGIIGFPEYTTYRLLEPQGAYPLKFLQAVEAPEISFACMDAVAIQQDYQVPLSEAQARSLALEQEADAMVLAIVVVPEDPRQATANLAGPLVINIRTLKGLQIDLDIARFPLRHPVFQSRDELILEFPQGLVGYPDLTRLRLFEPQDSYPLKFLQAEDRPEVSFPCIEIGAIRPDFEAPLSEEEAADLALEKPEEALLLALVTVPGEARMMTANLAGPLVVNVRSRLGRQLVLPMDRYPLRHRIIPDA